MCAKMESKNTVANKRFGVLDIFIILVVILCAVGIGLRLFFAINRSKDDSFAESVPEEFYISYISRNVRNTVSDYLTEDTLFRFDSTNDDFGYPFRAPTVQPAEKRYTGSDGAQYIVPNLPNDDRTDRNDIFGMFKVKGRINDEGLLQVDGSNEIICLNKEYVVRSDFLVFRFIVVGITKAP